LADLPVWVEADNGKGGAVQEFVAQADVPVLGYAVKSSTKMARNEPVSPLAESGKVWLPRPRHTPCAET
jgi:phage terminase large subunit-like protein